MKKFIFISLLLVGFTNLFAQQVELTFTGRNPENNAFVQLSRVEIKNITRGWTEILIYPDTVAVLTNHTGVNEYILDNKFHLSQNNPNPCSGATDVNLMVTEAGTITMEIIDVNGRVFEKKQMPSLRPGLHQFHINMANIGVYSLTVCQNGNVSFIKMINIGNGPSTSIEYVGAVPQSHPVNSPEKSDISNQFVPGDVFTYKGYAVVDSVEIEGQVIEQQQKASETITLMVQTTGRPCEGTPTVTDYDGNIYNTVQIGNQCWMRENLKTRHYANGTEIPQLPNSSMVDPSYDYPGNMLNNVDIFGLVYNWPAVMGGESSSNDNPSGVQGICPNGWHVPSDAEWKELEIYAGVPSEEIDDMNTYRGTVAATLCGGYPNTWMSSSNEGAAGNFNAPNRNITGFSVLPAGAVEGMDVGLREMAEFWSSTLFSEYNPILRTFHYSQAGIRRNNLEKAMQVSVRCLKD